MCMCVIHRDVIGWLKSESYCCYANRVNTLFPYPIPTAIDTGQLDFLLLIQAREKYNPEEASISCVCVCGPQRCRQITQLPDRDASCWGSYVIQLNTYEEERWHTRTTFFHKIDAFRWWSTIFCVTRRECVCVRVWVWVFVCVCFGGLFWRGQHVITNFEI